MTDYTTDEVAPHRRRWDSKKCKRNKGAPHEMQLVKDELKTRAQYRFYNVPGWRVTESRPFQWYDREWRCTHCGKKEVTDSWTSERLNIGEWREVGRSKRVTPK